MLTSAAVVLVMGVLVYGCFRLVTCAANNADTTLGLSKLFFGLFKK